MENTVKQKRVESSSVGERMIPNMPQESFERDNTVKSWIERQLYGQMSQGYNHQESEYAAAVSAAAFVISSVEEEEEQVNYRRRRRDEAERVKTRTKTIKEDATDGSVWITRSLSSKEVKDSGETSTRKPTKKDQSTFPTRKPSRSSSIRLTKPADQLRTGSSTRRDVKDSKVATWENERLRKIHKWYEKTKAKILEWENGKKMQAKLSMEKKKSELELRRSRNFQHYQNKVSRIEMVAGGARTQLEDKRRSQEAEVKEKAKYMQSKGRAPVNCFCC